ncbi:ribosomal protein L2-like protein [Leptotrombidium deliense]|uniref:Ribosomal protein L2-like protein n=1 Tax=Leptotrombidium deliense TaxID=299467 RepID=A0A443SR68_9ACAR|nr:ribosomal protein L2-like protein [Leptotrombidium deliense]
MGGGRPPIPLKVMPREHDFNWQPIYPKDGEYTVQKLKIKKLAGRDPETGKVVVRTLGGGNKKYLKWVDYRRWAPEGETIEEKVFKVVYSPLHTALLALVAREGHKRWIIASENMKPGDIIKTINVIPRNPIPGEEGNAYPVGALLPGTLIHNIEKIPNQPGLRPEIGETRYCINAGTHATILRRWKDSVVIKLPNGSELTVSPKCMAVVGKVSNVNHYTVNYLIPQRMRWKGIRPRSGLWHKKDGYCGRKMRKPKPLNFLEGIPEKPVLETQPLHLLAE